MNTTKEPKNLFPRECWRWTQKVDMRWHRA